MRISDWSSDVCSSDLFGLFVSPIGWAGLFLVAVAMLFILIFFSVWPSDAPVVDYKEDMPNRAVVQRLDSLLVRRRAALPAPAARRLDAIGQQLPLLEQPLAETTILHPLPPDAPRPLGRSARACVGKEGGRQVRT